MNPQDEMAQKAGHEARLRRVEEEREVDEGEEKSPGGREEEELDLVPHGHGQVVMTGVVSAREPRRDRGLRAPP